MIKYFKSWKSYEKYIERIIKEELSKSMLKKLCIELLQCNLKEDKSNKEIFGTVNICDEFSKGINSVIPVLKIFITGLELYTEENTILFKDELITKEDVRDFLVAIVKEITKINKFANVKSLKKEVTRSEYDILVAVNLTVHQLNKFIEIIKRIYTSTGKECILHNIHSININEFINGDLTFMKIDLKNKVIVEQIEELEPI